ncbi:MAG: penicillin acylase family protein [Pedobacter sp.]|nr:MAG: penicillin acylase family protein [Pedobacter sp.]
MWALNRPWGSSLPMPIGKFISPQHGFWQNAESASYDYTADLKFPGLKGEVQVYFDDRLVPHIFAENDDDLYFAQGYLHARFRLFQMDLQTKAAAGRASEVAGERAVKYDKEQRRLGMVFAAENALKEMEADPVSKAAFSSYTQGVNTYIESLKESEWPLEYKLLNIQPEKWTNLRTALLLKMMAKMLASGTESDLAYTNAKAIFTPTQFNAIYPQVPDSLLPIIPKGTAFDPPGIIPVKPATADSLYFNDSTSVAFEEVSRPDRDNGSNNWVVAGTNTASGAPILCNDPHLELSLPSIWYEVQLSTPTSNAYGVSLPGSPFVIIGFNDSIAWGVTNAQRDVKDYYEIRFKDESRKEYFYNGQWVPTRLVEEKIQVKGGATILDTVVYTLYGPVMYDRSFSDSMSKQRNLAIRWIAHDPSNDGWTFYKLNRAKNYTEYTEALKFMVCPGQNFVFASKTGDIAIWQQGKFPARWEGQGLYVMPGEDSSFNWQGFIPQQENPHSLNPARGFLESANQRPVDSTYPYFIPGSYMTPRGIAIEHLLNARTGLTIDDMKKLQYNYYNVMAEYSLPILFKYVDEDKLNDAGKKYLQSLKAWNLDGGPDSKEQTIYEVWWDSLEYAIWNDDIHKSKPAANMPDAEITMELLKKDSTNLAFVDNINSTVIESLTDQVTASFNQAASYLSKVENEGNLAWSVYKRPGIYHLIKDLKPFARQNLHVGGAGTIINAIKQSHGPSWRMIAQMGFNTEAYGVYPGGQNGNPGSRFYDNFVDTWVKGEYFLLWVMKKTDGIDKRVKWTMKLSKA